ncbi:hypothetical protein [Paraburkholderia sp. SIMBA_054]|uniref:hypothetical protein n=1 Tax=Paraburkholderia sp. SIMBA_054 TaxID=3085795 RepID=UPI00397A8D1E
MEYIPEEMQRLGVVETTVSDLPTLTTRALIRCLPVVDVELTSTTLFMVTPQVDDPLSIPRNWWMKFGTEVITASEYFRQVIERGDMVDAVVMPARDGAIPVQSYWIHIEYSGTPSGYFRKKDDGLFAMWTKSGEKAERVVARILRDDYGHSFHADRFNSPGFFEIRYDKKKIRSPDMTCLACGLTFEVKKRNRDTHFRPSHSSNRPFASENRMDGWHAFVFPDMKPRFIPNASIAQAIAEGCFWPGQNQYDSWAEVDHLTPTNPPYCSSAE